MLSATGKSLLGSHQLRCRPLQYISFSASAVRYASLSAIHKGLRRSWGTPFGGPRVPRPSKSRDVGRSVQTADDFVKSFNDVGDASSGRSRPRSRTGPGRKASAAEDEDGAGRQTGRKGFFERKPSFENRRQTRQSQSGSGKDAATYFKAREPHRPRSWTSDENDPRRDTFDDRRTSRQSRDDLPRQNQSWQDRPRHDEPRQGPRREQESFDNETDFANVAAAGPVKRGMMPMMLSYTTAASQFLYGTSVVKAALEIGRRQMYRLYVYGGENRRDNKDNEILMDLARSRGVPITVVPTEEQRLMDKMSMGRPHNGFVLEASQLPLFPVKSLGRLEETTSKLGFHLELDHQNPEQKSVNGEDSFIRKTRNSTTKPLVLLLHEIVDPGNLGAVLRTASYMGIDAVGITNRGSAPITPVVLKSASGSAEQVPIFTVESSAEFLQGSRAMGWKTYSAIAPPDKKLVRLHSQKFISTDSIEQDRPLDQHPCVLVMGNEGLGLPRQIKVATDYELSIPKFTRECYVDSLNVSVATALLCHSFVKDPVTPAAIEKATGRNSQRAVQAKKPSSAESEEEETLF
ncbi:hypothetical protein E4U13_001944 [Claviceps humidiphila]|uniref:rRNA methyltransferase 1, mitochondrial n=1 Tax=Claviceps humidiphila TaxID=1294629 RepID=A0A9P7TWW7_9HYPO|nr:hypothetical protein E4U13_001944 [Claviceps humidiphila]